ncbi:methionine--tRNA ligase [candidate division WWE3 bacterium]|uniref:Methionine--tRNA ligase n=1 Tax=candidate division WWE3 bacterium TaxID=2053526 RepID=A0A7X9HGX1_UNCKA|nr:methionine--tRNA ligase [candidate division WWE3 bacterium]
MTAKVLITTAIDYVNDVIHIGHAYQKVLADCVARYERLHLGNDNVYFLTGTDEYGTTNEKAAAKRNITPKEHVDEISGLDKKQIDSLNVSYNRFIRTTDEDHKKIAQEFFAKSLAAGDIYKSHYEGLYCEGCESYKTISELNESGQCNLHPTRQIQKIDEEDYFFRWTKYQSFLLELLQNERFVLPEGKRKEMVAFVEQGLKDIPVTRPKYKVTWGIEAPNDPEHVIYVWFDALINYYTAGLQNGFWNDETNIVHFLGKDNARWHVLLWPAMLKSAGLRIPDTIYVHGFVNLNGQKISKSLGNIIRPDELVAQFGVDPVRYYLLKHGPIIDDVNISLDHIKEVYNSDLANGLGNTVARLAKMAEKSGLKFELKSFGSEIFSENWAEPFKDYRVDVALQNIWKLLSEVDKHINENQPWAITDQDKLKTVLTYEVDQVRKIALLIEPYIPTTAKQIQEILGKEIIKSSAPLFPRLQ